MPSKTVFLSLGANLGDRAATIEQALELMKAARVHVRARSALYETEPQGLKDQPWFLNLAIEVETDLFPLQLLSTIQGIERSLGRLRKIKNGPRPIDIDILLYGKAIIETPQLTVPHPRMLERRFVLQPLLEIAGALRHPATGKRLREHLPAVLNQRLSPHLQDQSAGSS